MMELVLSGIFGMITGALVTRFWFNRVLEDVQEESFRIYEHRHSVGSYEHKTRVVVEQASTCMNPWPSGRTWTDGDGVVHSVPAGRFAITICGLEIPCLAPEKAEVVDRYPYEMMNVAGCMECLARERAP